MKICRIKNDKLETYGIVVGDYILTKSQIVDETGIPIPDNIKDFMFDGWYNEIKDKISDITEKTRLDKYTILAPIANPSKIICVAFNYTDHASDQNMIPPDDPAIVIKPKTTLTGTNSDLVCPKFARKLDYEIELGVIIGEMCKSIDAIRAKEVIFGYTIMNDASSREIQFGDGQFTRGKGFDTFAPCGPYITTADEIIDPDMLSMKTFVNGDIRQNSSTSKAHIKTYDMISKLSQVMTLERGDIISTGTPTGVALNNPNVEFLKHGDKIRMEIQDLGILENIVKII
ncbi:MAG: fumarylacetoacetate hydrolase family protein [Candidatus Nitrosoabyssus spongiisocia]|nr:MAG: fumarylacetoacetate hydrolase family protein [Nitrosopumilaceae archaeon AB1(1)]